MSLISVDQYELTEEELGKGREASVMLAFDRRGARDSPSILSVTTTSSGSVGSWGTYNDGAFAPHIPVLAVKRIRHQGPECRDYQDATRQADLLLLLKQRRCPHIVEFLGIAHPDPHTLDLVLSACGRENLLERSLREAGRGGAGMTVKAREHEVRGIIAQVLGAVVGMHGEGVAHLDLKPENIMVSPMGAVSIVDFGSARHVLSPTLPLPLDFTHQYLPPEGVFWLTLGRKSGGEAIPMAPEHMALLRAVDVWAVGVVTYTLLAFRHPFGPPVDSSAAELVEWMSRQDGRAMVRPPTAGGKAWAFCQAALRPDLPGVLDVLEGRSLPPARPSSKTSRPTAQELSRMKWMTAGRR